MTVGLNNAGNPENGGYVAAALRDMIDRTGHYKGQTRHIPIAVLYAWLQLDAEPPDPLAYQVFA